MLASSLTSINSPFISLVYNGVTNHNIAHYTSVHLWDVRGNWSRQYKNTQWKGEYANYSVRSLDDQDPCSCPVAKLAAVPLFTPCSSFPQLILCLCVFAFLPLSRCNFQIFCPSPRCLSHSLSLSIMLFWSHPNSLNVFLSISLCICLVIFSLLPPHF